MSRSTDRAGLTAAPLAPPTIGFRLDDDSRQVLGERAARLGISPHELARHYVMEVLQEREERVALRQAVQHLNGSLDQFRADFAFAVEALLTSAGTVSNEKARAWVEESIKPD